MEIKAGTQLVRLQESEALMGGEVVVMQPAFVREFGKDKTVIDAYRYPISIRDDTYNTVLTAYLTDEERRRLIRNLLSKGESFVHTDYGR